MANAVRGPSRVGVGPVDFLGTDPMGKGRHGKYMENIEKIWKIHENIWELENDHWIHGVSENVVYPIVPNGFHDHYPYEKLLFHWECTLFSDKPIHGG